MQLFPIGFQFVFYLSYSIQLFTFVGNHFLQMESKASFDIACTAIDVLVPHILKASKNTNQVRELSVTILETFVDASSDMPRHRFCIFMQVLLNRLGVEEYLWLLTLLLIKAKSKQSNEEKRQQLIGILSLKSSNIYIFSIFFHLSRFVWHVRPEPSSSLAFEELEPDDQSNSNL